MSMKKNIMISLALAGLMSTGTTFAQSCNSPGVDTVLAGSNLGTLVRMTNRSCGVSGWVCLDATDGGVDQNGSNRVYAAALTAQASGSAAQVSWDPSNLNCDGRFPAVVDFRTIVE